MNSEPNNLPWLDEEFVRSILSKEQDIENSTIESYRCEFASQTGENYSSILYRLKVNLNLDGTIREKSYIIKCMQSPDSDMGKLLKEFGLFKKEFAMYSKTLTEIENALKNIGSELQIAPKLFHTMNGSYEILVIEDLQSLGYQLANRLVGMDLEHCQMVFKMLAKYHATSMFLNKQNPQFRQCYNEGAFTENLPETMATYFKNGVSQATGVIKQLPNCQKYIPTFESFYNTFIKDGIELQRPVPENHHRFNVLNHGDLWINNIMFKYNSSGKPVDVKFIDFQMTNFGCPGIDINYFFYTSSTEETRATYRNELLALYNSTLVDTLQKFKYDGFIPSLDDLHKELLRAKDIAIMTPCIVLPLVKLDKDKSTSMTTDDIMNEDTSGSRQILYDNKSYHEALEIALKHLESIGFI